MANPRFVLSMHMLSVSGLVSLDGLDPSAAPLLEIVPGRVGGSTLCISVSADLKSSLQHLSINIHVRLSGLFDSMPVGANKHVSMSDPINVTMTLIMMMCTMQGPGFLPALEALNIKVNSEFDDDFAHVAALPSLRRLTVTWQHGCGEAIDDGALDGLTTLT